MALEHQSMNAHARNEAEKFLVAETAFHLGDLPTEQSHPQTRGLDRVIARDVTAGLAMLQAVDRDLVPMLTRVFSSVPFQSLVDTGTRCLRDGGRLVFSGCGATGRLSILLESMWRRFFIDLGTSHPSYSARLAHWQEQVASIMTGGDYALVRSVESFEDYAAFGARQAEELGLGSNDLLIAITEGGETSSVLGTVQYALETGATPFLVFNNPTAILCRTVERSRRLIEEPRVQVLDLFTGPMAIAGSTRMQATTAALMVIGAALEKILANVLEEDLAAEERQSLGLDQQHDYGQLLTGLLDDLETDRARQALAAHTTFEETIYRQDGLITYFADGLLLDIFTDTTERAPTFMLPPFRKRDDDRLPVSWAFVKHPRLPTPETWQDVLGRPPRCLDWSTATYTDLGAADRLRRHPPPIDQAELMKFLIGNEPDPSRQDRQPNAAVAVLAAREIAGPQAAAFEQCLTASATTFDQQRLLVIGRADPGHGLVVDCAIPETPLRLMERVAAKLVLNTISTATMARLGRVTSNWMSWVEASNKKLVDRSIRLVSELAGVSYHDACYALFAAIEQNNQGDWSQTPRPSPVQVALANLGGSGDRETN